MLDIEWVIPISLLSENKPALILWLGVLAGLTVAFILVVRLAVKKGK